jgi:flagellar biosynthetic protein FliR
MTISADILWQVLSRELALNVWPFFRVAGVLMIAPVFGTRLVPVRVRAALAIAVTFVLAPVLPAPAQSFEPNLLTALLLAQELLLGVAIGFCLQMIFDALIIAGQTISMGMGLGFAMMVDPQRGVSVPVLGQFFVILGMLIFLALGGHLATLRLIADSFEAVPLGTPLPMDGVWVLVTHGSQMFAGALRIALPAITALLVVNLALGVMSRAAPTLNLFAVGLPAGLLLGFLILLVNIDNLTALMTALLDSSLAAIARMLAA